VISIRLSSKQTDCRRCSQVSEERKSSGVQIFCSFSSPVPTDLARAKPVHFLAINTQAKSQGNKCTQTDQAWPINIIVARLERFRSGPVNAEASPGPFTRWAEQCQNLVEVEERGDARSALISEFSKSWNSPTGSPRKTKTWSTYGCQLQY
jgi:hypothetical protein